MIKRHYPSLSDHTAGSLFGPQFKFVELGRTLRQNPREGAKARETARMALAKNESSLVRGKYPNNMIPFFRCRYRKP